MKLAPKRVISLALAFLIAIYGSISQTQQASAVARGADFTVTVSDLQFILQQIRIAEAHRAFEATSPAVTPSINVLAAGRTLSDPRGPSNTGAARTITISTASTRVLSPLLPEGLRQTDGRNNNLTGNGFSSWMGFGYITPVTLGKSAWGSADSAFPRIAAAKFKTGYENRSGNVTDASPRVISNLISDQSSTNPAARAAASCTLSGPNACVPSTTDGVSLSIANRATDGVAAPYNGMFALFGQFFDHGLDLVGKSSTESVKIPLATSDPLYTTCVNLTRRGCVTEISMGRTVLGDNPATAGTNTTTPWIDQNQTYTSHPSHQVFLREYKCASESSSAIDPAKLCSSSDKPIATGKLLDGDIAGNIANWSEVKRQTANKLGIQLVDMDIHDVPLLLTDEYGRFLRSASGFPQVVDSASGTTASVRVGDPANPILISNTGLKTGHAFLNDISHFAAPSSDLAPDPGTEVNNYPGNGYYDNELLDAHFITGDGRGNENIGLTAVHTIFHAEHNRLWTDIQAVINSATTGSTGLTAAALADFKNAWRAATVTTANPNPEWNGERLFHAAKLITEMEYQHLVFGEFARKVQPLIKPFVGYDPTIRPDITGEFAHAVYRYGHSQLNETVDRTSAGGTANDLSVPLLYAFLNPTEFNQPHSYPSATAIGETLTGRAAAGSIVRGMANQTGNEIDEFVTGALRNSLLGLPLDLATLNIARGRDAGVQSLNDFRRTLKASTGITSLAPYSSWAEFGQSLRHPQSLVNFVAAYGKTSGPITFLDGATHLDDTDTKTVSLDSSDNDTSYIDKRAAAQSIVDCYEAYQGIDDSQLCVTFMLGTSGLNDIDLWVGGLAENNTQAGTMLGSTFDYVFKKQLENLQESDRFYYLGRLAGLNLTVQIETNFFSDIIQRNTDITSITTDAFAVPTYTVNMPTKPSFIKILADGTWMYTGNGHVLWNGTTGNDKILSDRGDDSIYGDAGNDWLRGGDGNDFIQGGEGRDVIEDSAGLNILIGGNGNDYISGSGTDAYNGNGGDDFIVGGTFPVVGLAGIGSDWILGGSDNDVLSGDEGNDWIEGGQGGDGISGDVVGAAGITLTFPGRDVLIGNSGNDLLDGFDGADIYVPGDGTDLNTGGLGFDWATYFNDGQVGGVNEDLSNFAPAPGLVLANLADQFQEIEGLSGGIDNDILAGTSVTALGGAVANGLTATDCSLITGLTALLPSTITNCVWDAGDILIGGPGSDEITGRNGNDLIDGDAVLQTWISIPDSWSILNEAPNYVTVPAGRVYVSSMATIREYIATNLVSTDVISDLQIVRLIAQSGHSTENDVAVYQANRANYTITVNANGTITVADPRNGGGATIDGTDTLRNIETLRFTDGDVLVSSLAPAAPRLIALGGAAGGAGTIAVTWSATGVGSGVTIANYTARAWTTVNRTGTPVGTCTTADGSTLTCTISAITGAPAGSGINAGNYYVDVIATSSAAIAGARSAVIGPIGVTQLVAPAISLSTQNLNGTRGIAITATSVRSAVGFSGSVTYAVTSGTLPAGLELITSTGAITGTPTVAATTTSVTITATDSASRTASAIISITIADPAAASISPSTQTLSATQGVAITTTSPFNPVNFTPTGYSITGGTLPGGLSFDSNTGRISGTPNSTLSTTTFTITATDTSNSATATIAITVSAAIAPLAAGAAPRSAPTVASVSSGAAGTGTAVVLWSAVESATRYTAQAFSSTNSTKVLRQCSVSGTGGATTFTCTISNLQRYVTYYVDVVARNNAGGLSSASRLPVTIL